MILKLAGRPHSSVGSAAVMALSALVASAASSQVSIFSGSSQANACSMAAKAPGVQRDAIATCTIALEHEPLVGRNLAGTYVNRGVLYLRDGETRRAIDDFEAALAIDRTMGEALINRGAAKIAQRQFREGVEDIDRGLALNPEEPEKAYYNRGLARERMGDLNGAYQDYRKAQELAPAWAPPQVELKRFTVGRRSGV